MSCVDMDQEDELDAEEETSVLETKLNIELSREHREHIRFCNDNKGNPPGILKSETVDPLPDLLKNMIRRLVRWHVLPPDCVPDSCIVNIYEEGDCIPPHIDSHDFVRPFCTVSFLSECNIVFGSNLKTVGPGDFAGAIAIPLPMGSVLVLNGNRADVAKHSVATVPTKRISITFRRMDESRRPIGCAPEQDLLGLQPLSHEADRCEKSSTSKPWHSTREQLGRREDNKKIVGPSSSAVLAAVCIGVFHFLLEFTLPISHLVIWISLVMLHGEPSITWKSSEIRDLIIQENLQYAIIGKFSYGKPNIMELRKQIPVQCNIKGDCNIGVLDARHILIRLNILEDYVNLMSTAAFYIKAKDMLWQMRTRKWDPWLDPDIETTIGVAWISMPDLPPNFFAKKAIFSIASAVGKPLMVDMATKNKQDLVVRE
ncbi:hypothetical protein CQW23_03523 [Capsicum baccatum]|uniref:Fe2OG dioxygenase domain-containing protein n=1 Tax=Capsicum baccatum TaxID=33114 RepID=A0A2G2XC28_CAPBA|nr:hypothetical protein CQW23_03523 [Capsicum baccatum]